MSWRFTMAAAAVLTLAHGAAAANLVDRVKCSPEELARVFRKLKAENAKPIYEEPKIIHPLYTGQKTLKVHPLYRGEKVEIIPLDEHCAGDAPARTGTSQAFAPVTPYRVEEGRTSLHESSKTVIHKAPEGWNPGRGVRTSLWKCGDLGVYLQEVGARDGRKAQDIIGISGAGKQAESAGTRESAPFPE